jgi:hypothetical protein
MFNRKNIFRSKQNLRPLMKSRALPMGSLTINLRVLRLQWTCRGITLTTLRNLISPSGRGINKVAFHHVVISTWSSPGLLHLPWDMSAGAGLRHSWKMKMWTSSPEGAAASVITRAVKCTKGTATRWHLVVCWISHYLTGLLAALEIRIFRIKILIRRLKNNVEAVSLIIKTSSKQLLKKKKMRQQLRRICKGLMSHRTTASWDSRLLIMPPRKRTSGLSR